MVSGNLVNCRYYSSVILYEYLICVCVFGLFFVVFVMCMSMMFVCFCFCLFLAGGFGVFVCGFF